MRVYALGDAAGGVHSNFYVSRVRFSLFLTRWRELFGYFLSAQKVAPLKKFSKFYCCKQSFGYFSVARKVTSFC
jgi:hypothetical protein